jgi:hypothetical protein
MEDATETMELLGKTVEELAPGIFFLSFLVIFLKKGFHVYVIFLLSVF